MSSIKLKQTFMKPVVVGVVSYLGAKALGLDKEVLDVNTAIGKIPGAMFFGALGAGSSLVTESVHQWVLPYLPQSPEAVKVEDAILSPAIHAAVNVGAIYFLYPEMLKNIGIQKPVLLGAGAEVAGSYGFDNFIKPMDWMR